MKTEHISTAIKTVAFFRDETGRCCDRCGTFIKNVALVSYKDATIQSYGSECINKILSGDTSLQALWRKNFKLLQKWQRYLEILSLPEDQMPVDERGYYDRGVYFVADDDGKSLCYKHMYFHPTKVDLDKANFDGTPTLDMRNAGKTYWEPKTFDNWQQKCRVEIQTGKADLAKEIERIGAFLARVLAKGLVTAKTAG